MMRVVNSIMDLIGNTPVVELGKIGPTEGARLLVKLEF